MRKTRKRRSGTARGLLPTKEVEGEGEGGDNLFNQKTCSICLGEYGRRRLGGRRRRRRGGHGGRGEDVVVIVGGRDIRSSIERRDDFAVGGCGTRRTTAVGDA
jgi:hypothetical protein